VLSGSGLRLVWPQSRAASADQQEAAQAGSGHTHKGRMTRSRWAPACQTSAVHWGSLFGRTLLRRGPLFELPTYNMSFFGFSTLWLELVLWLIRSGLSLVWADGANPYATSSILLVCGANPFGLLRCRDLDTLRSAEGDRRLDAKLASAQED
jgi:hypothetical protein